MSRKVNLDLERGPVGIGIRKVGQWVKFGDFTDGGSLSGYVDLAKQIPAGSRVLFSKVTVTAGFAGDTSAVMDIGSTSDTDLFSYTTHNVLAAAANLMEHADVSGAGTTLGPVLITSDTTVRVTVTGNANFTSISAGKAYVEVVYMSTNPEIIDISQTRYDG